MAATEDDLKRASDDSTGDQKTPSRLYREAINEATTQGVSMKRYISLFTDVQQRERGLPVQHQYLLWLKHQARLMKEYDDYELVDVVRAPGWGTNMARIITNSDVSPDWYVYSP